MQLRFHIQIFKSFAKHTHVSINWIAVTIFGLLSVIGYGIAFLITSTSLIVGILKVSVSITHTYNYKYLLIICVICLLQNKEQYLLPWLSFNIFLIAVRILLLLSTLQIISQSPYIFILYILLTSLAVYIFFCIISLYELMKANALEKAENSREADTTSVDSEHWFVLMMRFHWK